jgi:hypothetical protein
MARRATCWTRASLLFPGNFSRVAGIELPQLELSKNSRRALAAGKLFVQPRPPAGPRRSPDAGPADTAASTGRVCEPYMCAPSAVSFCHRETPGQVSSFLGGGCHWQVCRARRRRVFGAQINFKTGLTLTHAPPPLEIHRSAPSLMIMPRLCKASVTAGQATPAGGSFATCASGHPPRMPDGTGGLVSCSARSGRRAASG